MYFAVRRGTRCKIYGPCAIWQEACLHVFGYIGDDLQVFRFGETIGKEPLKTLEETDQWFQPIILNSVNGITLSPENAFSLPEIGQILLAQAARIRDTNDLNDVEDARRIVQPFLKFVENSIKERFAEVCDAAKVRIGSVDRIKRVDTVRSSGTDGEG